MKLFLSSLSVSDTQLPAFAALIQKHPKDIKIALIENAADGETGDKNWVHENRASLEVHEFHLDLVDLNEYKGNKNLRERLEASDAIWLGGGNTYYLRWILQATGADVLIRDLIQGGMVYGGGSAGAIVAGPTLKYFDSADNRSAAPEIIEEGLKLTDTVVVPHWDNPKFGKVIKKIASQLEKAEFKTEHLTDEQALVINGRQQAVIS